MCVTGAQKLSTVAQQRVSWQRLVNDGTAQVQRPGVARLVGLAEEHFCFVSVSSWPGHSAPSQVTEGDGLHQFRMVNSVCITCKFGCNIACHFALSDCMSVIINDWCV